MVSSQAVEGQLRILNIVIVVRLRTLGRCESERSDTLQKVEWVLFGSQAWFRTRMMQTSCVTNITYHPITNGYIHQVVTLWGSSSRSIGRRGGNGILI